MTRTAQLLALAEAATPGPWYYAFPHVRTDRTGWKVANVAGTTGDADSEADNARFIAASNPETIKQLVELMNKLVAGITDICRARDDIEMWGIANDTLEAFNKWEGE